MGKKQRKGLTSEYFSRKTKNDITPKFIAQDSVKIQMFLNEARNHLIAISTKPSYIEMEGAIFNDHLKENGMSNILSYREKNNLKEKRSREYYQRCAKTLLQVDGKNDASY